MVKRLRNLKNFVKKRRVELMTAHWLTVVQRLKVAFIREIWLLVRETGRFILYLGDSRIIPGELACMVMGAPVL